ncbi:MAG: Bax inhibitor-1/YccA family protein [Oscillospiraceae bacterium]|nr:Bax inhibitor-1/YccA family protein [Oscillospiraceae bacterium]
MARVMGWMCVGLLTTLVAAMACLFVPEIFYAVYGNSAAPIVIIVAQLAAVLVLSVAINRLSPAAATVIFMVYSALTGLTISTVVLIYDLSSIILAFGVSAFLFLAMSLYGLVTKKDLSSWGRLLFFGLLGIVAASLLNMFLGNAMLDLAVTCVGIVIFVALTAYDTQKIKGIYMTAAVGGYDDESPELRRLAIFGALTLYLDFINLFLKLLRLMGRRRR